MSRLVRTLPVFAGVLAFALSSTPAPAQTAAPAADPAQQPATGAVAGAAAPHLTFAQRRDRLLQIEQKRVEISNSYIGCLQKAVTAPDLRDCNIAHQQQNVALKAEFANP